MSNNPWGKGTPDLRSLPQHLREQLDSPLPLREGETHGRVIITAQAATGLVHPTGRLMFTAETTIAQGQPERRVQFSVADVSGRQALTTIILTTEAAVSLVSTLASTFNLLGLDTNILVSKINEIGGKSDSSHE